MGLTALESGEGRETVLKIREIDVSMFIKIEPLMQKVNIQEKDHSRKL